MADRRMISSSFWENESITALTIQQRLLFLGLISNADDQGRLRGNPALVRNKVFPLDEIPLETIRADLGAIAAVGSILLFEQDGKQYIQVTGWWKHQHPQWAWPSKIPPPPGWTDRLRYKVNGQTVEENWQSKSKSKSSAASPPEVSSEVSGEASLETLAEPLAEASPETSATILGLGIGVEVESGLVKDPFADYPKGIANPEECGVPAASPPDPPPSTSHPNPNPKPPLSPGQSALLQAFGAKRFKTDAQRNTVLELEQRYGLSLLQEVIIWAAKKGMRLNDAVSAIETALPKWGQPKANPTSPPPSPMVTAEQREQEALRSREMRLNAKPVNSGQ